MMTMTMPDIPYLLLSLLVLHAILYLFRLIFYGARSLCNDDRQWFPVVISPSDEGLPRWEDLLERCEVGDLPRGILSGRSVGRWRYERRVERRVRRAREVVDRRRKTEGP